MTKILIKKQLMENFSFFWQDRKHNTVRTGGKLVLWIMLYAFLFLYLSFIFGSVAVMLCETFVEAGLGWLYFSMMGLMAIAIGAFGSVLNTYATLYQAKDNDMLLAMPVKLGKLLIARLSGVYAMGFLYELLVMVPVLIIYYIVAKPGIASVALSLLVTLVISIFILTLSAVLGWAVAAVGSKTKHKSFVTVILSLGFIAGYYYVYSKAYGMIQGVLMEPETAADFVRKKLYPVYEMGLAAEGDFVAFLIFTAMVLAVFAAVYFVLEKSYIKIATANKGEAKKVYKERASKAGTVSGALIRKEAKHFFASPNYMLNCGLGIVFMAIAAVFVLIKGEMFYGIVSSVFGADYGFVSLLVCGAVCLMSCMNDISAPSVSLEGKSIWLLQSLPVTGWQVLRAKLAFHLIASLIPLVFLTISLEMVLRPALEYAVLILITVTAFAVFMAEVGLFVNLLTPNLNWTSEIVPIKQSAAVMIVLLGGWAFLAALGGLYFAVLNFVSPFLYMLFAAVLFIAASAGLFFWLKNKGAEIFENL